MVFLPNKVIYHTNCCDGFGAAFAVWKRYQTGITYTGLHYSNQIPKFNDDDRVLVVDFSFNKEVCDELSSRLHKFYVLDHHKTAAESIGNCRYAKIDVSKSGAMLAWEWCSDKQPPDIIKYIQDRDLWKFELQYSREYNAALQTKPFNFELWDQLKTQDMINYGAVVLDSINRYVDERCSTAKIVRLCGYEVPIVYSEKHNSDIGAKLLDSFNSKFSVVYCSCDDGNTIKYSLRCKSDFDVSEIAKKFGGGGHKQAAGFTVDYMRDIYD
jgi:oligoribonuclease NrnB/cAMP/cGMP phosphodiesterase (DHH superfamily)